MSGNEPTPPPASGDDQPTVPFTPTDHQATEAYPPAYGAPVGQPAYGAPADAPPAYGAPAYGGQPAYGAPAGAQPPYGAPQATGPDTRPKRVAWIALGVGLVGLVFALVGFIPVLGVGFTFALLGSLFLFAALIIAIVALVSKNQGGTGLAIGAIVVSVVGGVLASIALVFGLILFGLSAAGSSGGTTEPIPVPSVSQDVTEDTDAPEEPSDGDVSATYDEAAYVALVRPQITTLMQEIQPGITDEIVTTVFSDDMLVATGKLFLSGGEAARQATIEGFAQSGDMMTREQAERFVDIIATAAEQYLQ